MIKEAAAIMYGTRNDLSKATRVIWGLMDIQLPGADGYEATRRITANPVLRGIPVIVVTSCALRGDKVKGLAAGANGYVSKPFGPRALLAKPQEYIAR